MFAMFICGQSVGLQVARLRRVARNIIKRENGTNTRELEESPFTRIEVEG
jgi:hypothetical protein